tara:strand:+ start:177 stop:341 length:165 start_codon:yes stop_codon:yes gene_type:complete
MADDELMDGSAFSEDDLDGFDCDMDGDDFSLSTSQGFDGMLSMQLPRMNCLHLC